MHGKMYSGMLPEDHVLVTHLKRKVDTLLRDELNKARRSTEAQAPEVGQEVPVEALSEELEDLS